MPTTKKVLDRLRPAPDKLMVDEVTIAADEAGYLPKVTGDRGQQHISFYLGSDFVVGNIEIGANGQIGVVYVEEFVGETKVRFKPRFVNLESGVAYPEFESHYETLQKLGYQVTKEFEVGSIVTTPSNGVIPNATFLISCLPDDIRSFLTAVAQNLAADVGDQFGVDVQAELNVTVTQLE